MSSIYRCGNSAVQEDSVTKILDDIQQFCFLSHWESETHVTCQAAYPGVRVYTPGNKHLQIYPGIAWDKTMPQSSLSFHVFMLSYLYFLLCAQQPCKASELFPGQYFQLSLLVFLPSLPYFSL